jgi:hypothetical protein
MPFKSAAQRAWGHTPVGVKALGGEAKVAEWDAATPAKLPRKLSELVKLPKTGKSIGHPHANLGKYLHPKGGR